MDSLVIGKPIVIVSNQAQSGHIPSVSYTTSTYVRGVHNDVLLLSVNGTHTHSWHTHHTHTHTHTHTYTKALFVHAYTHSPR